ncbi:hypothetical protein M2311_006886, partial [Rhizobium leguminosarum]|nr:hypothetical protein [Rhizobium leguminosarum]
GTIIHANSSSTEGAIIRRAAERVCNVAMAITDLDGSGERPQGSFV